MSTEQIQSEANINEFLKVLDVEHGAALVDSQTNANMLSSFLLANGQRLTVGNMIAAVLGPLRHAISWVTPPSDEATHLPRVPDYMDIRSKTDLARLMKDGDKFIRYMRGKHAHFFKARVDAILKNNITG